MCYLSIVLVLLAIDTTSCVLDSDYVLLVTVQSNRKSVGCKETFFSLHVCTVIMERQGVQGCALERDFELFLIPCQWEQ